MLGDGWIDDLSPWGIKAARVPTSSAPINREYPATSAARMAAKRLWTRRSVTGGSTLTHFVGMCSFGQPCFPKALNQQLRV